MEKFRKNKNEDKDDKLKISRRNFLSFAGKVVVTAALGKIALDKMSLKTNLPEDDCCESEKEELEIKNHDNQDAHNKNLESIPYKYIKPLSEEEGRFNVRDENDIIHNDEIYPLIWNIYNEATKKGDPSKIEDYLQSRYNRLSILLVTLNRAMSPKFPSSLRGVIYQKKQFSWTMDSDKNGIIENDETKKIKKEKVNLEVLKDILDLIKECLGEEDNRNTIGSIRESIKLELESAIGVRLPEDICFYKSDQKFSMTDATKRFFAKMKKVANIGGHDLYVQRA